MSATATDQVLTVSPSTISPNPNNPRRYFNEEQLDLLKTSLQEVGVLQSLIVFADPKVRGRFVLLDGERRWRSAIDLGLPIVPVSVIPEPTTLENLLRMFNIHSLREDWPLISVALSLKTIIELSGELRETRLSQMTGLSRSSIRRAKRILSLPDSEIERIKAEAHLERSKQVHREDLYLEIEAAESVLRSEFPEVLRRYRRPHVIRQFVRKREEGHLKNVTDFRGVSKLVKAVRDGVIEHERAATVVKELIDRVDVNPAAVFEKIAGSAAEQHALAVQAAGLAEDLASWARPRRLSADMRTALTRLRQAIEDLLG